MSDAVLIVEDNWHAARALERAFRDRLHVEVTLAPTGGDALRAVRDARGRFLLALVDQGLPDLDGHAVAAGIRQIDAQVMAVLVTGQIDAHAISHRAAETTGGRFLLKPFELAQLEALVVEARSLVPDARIDAAVHALAEEYGLTDAEEHVVRLAAHGLSRTDIRRRLGVSEHTMVSRIRSTLGKWRAGANDMPSIAHQVLRRALGSRPHP